MVTTGMYGTSQAENSSERTKAVARWAHFATVMATGSWVDPDSMAGYVEIPVDRARRGYEKAMRSIRGVEHTAPVTRVLTPEELLRRGL
jgi:hypothetical protein